MKKTTEEIKVMEDMLVESQLRRGIINLLQKSTDQVLVQMFDSDGIYLGKGKPEVSEGRLTLRQFTVSPAEEYELHKDDSYVVGLAAFNLVDGVLCAVVQ